MKKLRILLMLVILFQSFTIVTFAAEFSDLTNSHWAYKNVTSLVSKGVIKGYEDGTYKPEKAVTRGEFIKLIMTSLYEESFFDRFERNTTHWAGKYARVASRSGYLMNGTTINNLNDEISRLEMAVILARICNKTNISLREEKQEIEFSDLLDLSEENVAYINVANRNGLINGYTDKTFKPNKTMTRAEVATVIYRFINLKEKGEIE